MQDAHPASKPSTIITLLYKETAQRIDFETIDKLCELFGCRIEDLLEKK
ncbi:MAG: helix-turn-helix transcriptional regulator [Rheinheimera sp.]|nr:helix-turn-helix transcriptional regulator [Rheinheimera sp.]